MTTQEYIKKLNSKIDKLKTGIPVGIAAQDTHVKMAERIFEDGKNGNGGEIGTYNSTNPLYVNPNNAPKKFPTKGKPKNGKPGETKFKNGESHKTGYFESYKSYREKVGRQVKHVDFNMFGIFRSDFSKGVVKVGPLEYQSIISQEENKEKFKGFKSKYGDNVFQLSKQEKDNFKEILNFEVMQILK